jgi:hypothetical protein
MRLPKLIVTHRCGLLLRQVFTIGSFASTLHDVCSSRLVAAPFARATVRVRLTFMASGPAESGVLRFRREDQPACTTFSSSRRVHVATGREHGTWGRAGGGSLAPSQLLRGITWKRWRLGKVGVGDRVRPHADIVNRS